MKAKFFLLFTLLISVDKLIAQRNCSTFKYQQQQIKTDPSLAEKINAVEVFTRKQLSTFDNSTLRSSQTSQPGIIRIPVVVHILFHNSYDNISDALVQSQLTALNRDFRRKNSDTVNTPAIFKSLAADCEIEFQLAKSDPQGRFTDGIIRKYTPVQYWEANDKVKFSSEMGDDAWDPKSYLNIWVCNLEQVAGYSSIMGGPENKDGVVIGFSAFGILPGDITYSKGRTTVHEVGHWLNLKHLWGDSDCGDDLVDDTPKQANYNQGCPTGIRTSCGNAPNGDMYMNYMDFTNDACMNLFTKGQKSRMRALFAEGGIRNSFLTSKGLDESLLFGSPLPDDGPKWLYSQLYPNPATSEMTLDLAYDIRWMGKLLTITNLQGQTVMQVSITSKYQKLDISKLKSGMYFLTSRKGDGDFIKHKFIKL
ncbi:MAG: M43 family zinc metalloprotease [Chitinophagaceae bacterium]